MLLTLLNFLHLFFIIYFIKKNIYCHFSADLTHYRALPVLTGTHHVRTTGSVLHVHKVFAFQVSILYRSLGHLGLFICVLYFLCLRIIFIRVHNSVVWPWWPQWKWRLWVFVGSSQWVSRVNMSQSDRNRSSDRLWPTSFPNRKYFSSVSVRKVSQI